MLIHEIHVYKIYSNDVKFFQKIIAPKISASGFSFFYSGNNDEIKWIVNYYVMTS